MFGGGGMNPRKMQQMMKQMGIDVTEIDAESVTITTTDGEALVFEAPEVTRMDAQGTQTYQIVGEPETRAAGSLADDATDTADTADTAAAEDDAVEDAAAIPEDDVDLVAAQAGVGAADAREALEAEDGDLAAAIARLE
jgi:nascent polypeptide-associated complex subunit alpha